MSPLTTADRKRRGAWYTPAPLVRFLIDMAVAPAVAESRGAPVRVLDPACGDGRVLAAAAATGAVELVGVELQEGAAGVARAAVPGATIHVGDGRAVELGRPFDAVVGNPPYLGQLRTATTRAGRSALGGGPYADVAAEFLSRAVELARPDGGRVALVLPQSVLASRDTEPVRRYLTRTAAVEGIWWLDEAVFDAAVHVCVLVLRRGVRQGPVRRWLGVARRPRPDVAPTLLDGPTWSPLVADLAGVPAVDLVATEGRLGDVATAVAGFRDQYYGLVPHVSDGGAGVPLVTAGLVDVGACAWGRRPARFAKRRFAAPRVDVGALGRADPGLAAWFGRLLEPKVLVATQTRVLEAVVDDRGAWLPSVPVVAVLPGRDRLPSYGDVWSIGAVLTAPPVSAWALTRHVGAGLGSGTLKLSAHQLLDVPLPADADGWRAGAARLRSGDVLGCAEVMSAAYGVTGPRADRLLAWWQSHAHLQ